MLCISRHRHVAAWKSCARDALPADMSAERRLPYFEAILKLHSRMPLLRAGVYESETGSNSVIFNATLIDNGKM